MNIAECLARGLARAPSGVAFTNADGSRSWTYEQTADFADRMAVALAAAGLGPGAHVGVLSPNDPIAFMSVLGIVRAGHVWVPLSARSTASDLAELVNLTDCQVLIYASSMAATAHDILGRARSVRLAVALDAGGRPGDPVVRDWIASAGTAPPRAAADPESTAVLFGTGGTTGRPKAVQMPHRALTAMIGAMITHMPEDRPVQILAAPMTHAAGLLTFPVLAAGGTTIVHDAVRPQAILGGIERHRVTRFFLPPTGIYSLLAQPGVREHDYSSLRYLTYAASPMSADKLKEACAVFGPVMTQTFGQAEAPMIATFFGPHEHADAVRDARLAHRLASCGRASSVAEVEVMDDDGNLLPAGQRGEIVIRSALTMNGYYKDQERSREVTRGQWHATGDIGYIDADGYVYIVDRKRDMIITGGFNVFPSEVERVLWAHPQVQDCAVIGVPDDKWGERVTAVVELKAGPEASGELADELIGLCRTELGGIKAPKDCVFRVLPRSPAGKVLKRSLRDEYWAGQDRAV